MATFSRKVLLFGSTSSALLSEVRRLVILILTCSVMIASTAEAGWKYRDGSRITNTPTVPVAQQPGVEGSTSSNDAGSSPAGGGFPSTLRLNAKGWANASDNEAFFSRTGQTSVTCSISDVWDWMPTSEEPVEGEIEDDMTMRGGGWVDLVNGEAAGRLVLGMKYQNSLGVSEVHATTLARSTESRSVFSFQLTVGLPLGSGPEVTLTIPINIDYDVGETMYRAQAIDARKVSQGCAQVFSRYMMTVSELEVSADGWFLDMATSRAGCESFIATTTHGHSCPQ